MTNQYHFWGVAISLLFVLTAYALFDQLNAIYKRKKDTSLNDRASDVISLNRALGSYAGFFANFLLGLSYQNFDYYLVVTRAVAIVFLLVTFFEILIDRKDKGSYFVFILALVSFTSFSLLAFFNREFLVGSLSYVKAYAVFATLFLCQGYVHQIHLVRKHQKIGGLSVLSFQLYLVKEISMIAFGLTLGFSNGWPIVLMHGTILCFLSLLLWNFRQIRKKSNVG